MWETIGNDGRLGTPTPPEPPPPSGLYKDSFTDSHLGAPHVERQGKCSREQTRYTAMPCFCLTGNFTVKMCNLTQSVTNVGELWRKLRFLVVCMGEHWRTTFNIKDIVDVHKIQSAR